MFRPAVTIMVGSTLLYASPGLVSSAQALEGFYVAGSAGLVYFFDQEFEFEASNIDLDYDPPGYAISGVVGLRPRTNIRLELEAEYAFTDGEASEEILGEVVIDGIDYELDMFRVTANALLELWPIGSLAPYVGGGVGLARVNSDIDVDGFDAKAQNVFTVHAEFGLPVTLIPSLEFVPALRFTYAATKDELDVDDGVYGDNLFSAQLRTGLRYNF